MVRGAPHLTIDEVYAPEIRPAAVGWQFRVRYRTDGDLTPIAFEGWRPTQGWAERAARSVHRNLRADRRDGRPPWRRISP